MRNSGSHRLSGEDSGEVVKIGKKVFTDKIFINGKHKDHISKPEWMGYRDYPERGPGVEWINGLSLSEAELYIISYPEDNFDYSEIEEKTFVKQSGFDNGYAVAKISGLKDSEDTLFLLNQKTMRASRIPEEYKYTPIYI